MARPRGYGRLITEAYEPGTSCGPISAKAISIRAASSAFRARRATRPSSIATGWRPAAIRSSCSSRAKRPAALAVSRAGHVPLRLLLAGRRRAALPQDRGRAGRTGCATTAPMSTRTARSWRSTPRQAASTLDGGETLQADRVVVTAGAWVLKLFPELGGELKTYRTALAYVEPPADLKAAWEAAPVILDVGGKTDGYIDPAVRRRRHEIRLRPAQGADQRRRLEPRSRSKARARRSATCFRRRSPASTNTG